MRLTRAVVAAVLAVGAGVVVPAGVASAASSIDLSVTTASGACAGAATCTAEPTELRATVSIVDTVSVTFDTTGRPAAAPEPEDNPDVLSVAAADCTLSGLFARACTWPIPSGLHSKASAAQLLNGTYTVTACLATDSSCSADPTYAPSTFSVSVAPAAPAGVKAAASGGVVTVSWSADSAPDLAGYAVYRAAGTSGGYHLLWDCADNGAPLAGAAACGTRLSTTDSPGDGSWTYAVEALRYGSSPTGADPVASPASTVAIAVKSTPTTGTTTTTTAGGGPTTGRATTTTTTPVGSGSTTGTSASSGSTGTTSTGTLLLPPVQIATRTPTVTPASPLPDPEAPDPTALSAPSTIAPGFSETIPYKHGSSQAAASAGQDLGHSSGTSVTGIGLVAGALLALAAAAHLWYVRQESRRVGAHGRR